MKYFGDGLSALHKELQAVIRSHVMMHLNDCCKLKQHIREGKKCFRCI